MAANLTESLTLGSLRTVGSGAWAASVTTATLAVDAPALSRSHAQPDTAATTVATNSLRNEDGSITGGL